jgi:iron complex outermembrane receptor protein
LANSVDGTEVEAIPLELDQLERFESGQPFNAGSSTYIPNTRDPDGRRRSSHLNGMVTLQHQFTAGSSYRAAYQSLNTRRTYLDGPLGAGPFEAFATPKSTFEGDVDTLQARLEQPAGRYHQITLGYEFERERYLGFDGDVRDASGANRIHLRQRSNALYLQDQIRLLDGRLQLTAAGRVQVFSLNDPEFQGFGNPYSNAIAALDVPTAYTGDGAAAYFIPSIQTKLRAHVGNSFRAPSGYERFGGGFGSYFGDPRLVPERSVAVDAGIDQWLWQSRIQLSATWFYTNLQQTIRFVNSFAAGSDPFGRTFGGYANGGGGIARGVEFSGNVSPRAGTRVRAAYTYVNSDSRTPTVAPDYYRVLGLPSHVFTTTLMQRIRSRTQVTFDLIAQSSYISTISGGGTRRFRFSGPIKPDVVVSHRLNFGNDHDIEVYGKVENAFGQRPYEEGFIGPGAWFITGFRILM